MATIIAYAPDGGGTSTSPHSNVQETEKGIIIRNDITGLIVWDYREVENGDANQAGWFKWESVPDED